MASTVLDTAPRSEVAMIDPNRESGEVLIAEMASTNQGRQPIDLGRSVVKSPSSQVGVLNSGEPGDIPSNAELDMMSHDHQGSAALEGKRPYRPPLWYIVREIIAALFWLGSLTKLFVFDWDIWLVSTYLPRLAWITGFRLAIFMGALAILALLWRGHSLWGFVGYVVVYPFVLGLWRLPAQIIKRRSWTLALALVSIGLSLLRSIKSTVIIAAAYVVGGGLCAFAESPSLLIGGVVLLGGALVAAYVRTVYGAFRSPLEGFSFEVLDGLWTHLRKAWDEDWMVEVPLDSMDEGQRGKWASNMQAIIIYNRACYFIAEKLRDLRRSCMNAVIYVVRLTFVFLATAVTTFLMNVALITIDPSHYSLAHPDPNRFDLFYYSFSTLFGSSTGSIEPVSVASRLLHMAATIFSTLIFGVVVVFIVTSVQKSRDEHLIDNMIDSIRQHAERMEARFDERYGMTIPEAVVALERVRADLVTLVYYLSPSLRPTASIAETNTQAEL